MEMKPSGSRRRALKTLAGVVPAAALAASGLARAQQPAWPAPGKTVRIVVPFSPGGTTDLMGRMVAQGLAQRLGGQFVVDSKPGASGTIGSGEVARAAPDGYTLLVTTSSTHSIAPHLSSSLRYNTVTDFTPLAHLADSDLILLSSPTLPAKSIKDLLELARQKPGSINYTTSGVGTISHLVFEAFKAQTGVDLTHVPYKGTGNAIPDLMAGVVQLSLDAAATGFAHVKDGRLHGMAVTGGKRSSLVPDVPAIVETVPGFTAVSWFGLYGPAGMSPDLVRRINAETNAILQTPDMLARLKSMGLETGRGSAADFAAMVTADSARWGKLISDLKIKVN